MKTLIYIIFIFSLTNSFAREFTIATLNVENLFDDKHDEGKNDWEFLPLSNKLKKSGCLELKNAYYRKKCLSRDWNLEKLKRKIKAISESLKISKYGIPDLLAISEVENENVLSMLAKELGYLKYYISNSDDKRGIDVAILIGEKSPLIDAKISEIKISGDRFKKYPTRNILKATFSLNKKSKAIIYVNHWPSQGNPNTARISAAKELLNDIKIERKKDSNTYLIAMGDFNVISSNSPNPIDKYLLGPGKLIDTESFKKNEFRGTYFYKKNKKWNTLDKVLVSENFLKKEDLSLVSNSMHVEVNKVNSEPYFYKNKKKMKQVIIPKKFYENETNYLKSGVSDHFPVFVKFTYKQK